MVSLKQYKIGYVEPDVTKKGEKTNEELGDLSFLRDPFEKFPTNGNVGFYIQASR